MAAKVSRAVIIAAGMGSRLGPYTEERPKCMVEVAGRSIMGHQRAALSAHGVEDLHIVRGYLADRLIVEGATYYNNFLYKDNNILHSLMCAREALDRAVLITYSDIVYTEQVVGALLEAQGGGRVRMRGARRIR
jgi:choline kinase